MPGVSNAWTMPIKGRIDMLTTGVRTPVGIKVMGADLADDRADRAAHRRDARPVPGTRSVFAERVTSGNFVDFVPRRDDLARYGVTIDQLQSVIMSAIGGENVTTTIEGRERYPVNVRYPRELRDDLARLKRVLVPVPDRRAGAARAARRHPGSSTGPSMLRNENGFLAGYVFVDIAGRDVGSYVEEAKKARAERNSTLPPGYVLQWSGQYENMLRVRERLKIVVPITLALIFVLLFMNTKSAFKASLVMLAVPVLGHRGDLALLHPGLQRLDRRLGGHDRAARPRRRDRRLHAAVPRPVVRRATRRPERLRYDGRPRRGDRPRRRQAGTAEDDDRRRGLHGPAADHVVHVRGRGRHEAHCGADDRRAGDVVPPGIAGVPGGLQALEEADGTAPHEQEQRNDRLGVRTSEPRVSRREDHVQEDFRARAVVRRSRGSFGYGQTTNREKELQNVRLTVGDDGYVVTPSRVIKGVPVKMEVDLQTVKGCGRTVVISAFRVKKTVTKDDATIEFTPDKSGTIEIACGMNMVKGSLIVIDALASNWHRSRRDGCARTASSRTYHGKQFRFDTRRASGPAGAGDRLRPIFKAKSRERWEHGDNRTSGSVGAQAEMLRQLL